MVQNISHTINHKVFIQSPIEKVYETLTTPKGWDAWFTTGTHFTLKKKSPITFKWVNWGPDYDNVEVQGEVIDFVENKKLVFEWHAFSQDGRTQTVFLLTEHKKGTIVEVTDSGYPDTPEGHRAFNSCATGWGEAMTLLKFYLEAGLVYRMP